MAGHSKWANTKHRKAAVDAKRAKINARYTKQIEVAARNGGPDAAGNPALELAVSKAKKESVPNDNIDRAIKRGAYSPATPWTTKKSPTRCAVLPVRRCWWNA